MQLFKLVAAHVPLELLSRALVDKFHMAPRPAVIGNSILATVALQVSLQFVPRAEPCDDSTISAACGITLGP